MVSVNTHKDLVTVVESMQRSIKTLEGSAVGPQTLEEKADMIDFITSQTGGAVYLSDSQAMNADRIFSSRLSYNKGAMVVHMLRWK